MGGQRDRTQGDQIWIPGRVSKEHILKYKTSNGEQTWHAMSREVFPCHLVQHLASHGFLLDASRMKSLSFPALLTDGVVT